MTPGASYAIDGGDSFIYYGQVALNQQMGFFRHRSQVLDSENALSSRLMSRFGVAFASVGTALRTGAWQFLGQKALAEELKEDPVLVQWPVGTLEVTLWRGATWIGKTQVHDPSIQNFEVIAVFDAKVHVPQRLRAEFNDSADSWAVGGTVFRHRQRKQALATQHPDKPWHQLPVSWVPCENIKEL